MKINFKIKFLSQTSYSPNKFRVRDLSVLENIGIYRKYGSKRSYYSLEIDHETKTNMYLLTWGSVF